jgi:hypothetical protein
MRTGIQTDASSSVDTVFFFDKGRRFDASSLRIWLSTSASGNATIRRGVKIGADSIYFFESAQTIRPGGVFESNDDGVYCFAFAKTSSDMLSWSASQCADGSGINAAGETLADIYSSVHSEPEWITVVSGMTIPAAKHMTFPMPLVPMGNASQVAFNISCTTWPDTLWYQVVAASTPMDSLTVFNFGTTEAPNFLRYIVSAKLSGASSAVTTLCEYLDNAFTEKWSPTGLDFNPSVGSYTFPVKDIAGLYTGAKYIGIRVGADAAKPIVGLRVVMEMK